MAKKSKGDLILERLLNTRFFVQFGTKDSDDFLDTIKLISPNSNWSNSDFKTICGAIGEPNDGRTFLILNDGRIVSQFKFGITGFSATLDEERAIDFVETNEAKAAAFKTKSVDNPSSVKDLVAKLEAIEKKLDALADAKYKRSF